MRVAQVVPAQVLSVHNDGALEEIPLIHTEWPRRRGDVLTEYLPDGSAFLYDPNTEMVYPLTVTAAIVWEVCDGTHGSVAMVNELGDSFDAPRT